MRRLTALALMAPLLLAGCQASAQRAGVAAGGLDAASRTPRAYDPSSVLVRWKSGAAAGAISQGTAKLGLTTGRRVEPLGMAALSVGRGQTVSGAIASLRASGLVESAEPNWIMKLPARRSAAPKRLSAAFGALGTGSYLEGARNWGQAKIGMGQVWPTFQGAATTVVAVLDTGVDLNHPDLRPALVPGFSTFVEGGPQDYEGHGTHVSGIIAGQGLGDPGVRGVAPGCRIMPVKVMGPRGREGKVENVVAGIVWAVDHGATVINMSLGDEGTSSLLRAAVRYAQAHDVLVVAASGNFDADKHASTNTMNYPACYPGVMAVGATDEADALADFSFWGPWLSVTAPGVEIHSSVPGDGSADAKALGDYMSEQGTSMASPFVAGLAGLVRAKFPGLKAEAVKARIEASCKDLGDPGYDPHFGHGRIDAARALAGQ